MSTSKYSIERYNEFLDALPSLNVVGANTVKNLRTVPRIISVTDSNLDDLRKINPEEVLRIFAEQNEGVSSTTLQSYKSRIQQALKLFESYVDNPADFTKENVMKLTQQRATRRIKIQPPVKPAETNTFTVPVPLRSGLTTTIESLPRDLTKEEADRICTIVRAFAISDPNDLI